MCMLLSFYHQPDEFYLLIHRYVTHRRKGSPITHLCQRWGSSSHTSLSHCPTINKADTNDNDQHEPRTSDHKLTINNRKESRHNCQRGYGSAHRGGIHINHVEHNTNTPHKNTTHTREENILEVIHFNSPRSRFLYQLLTPQFGLTLDIIEILDCTIMIQHKVGVKAK